MQMTTQTRTNTPDKPHEPAAVLEAVPATALDGQTGTGAIAIFYGAARHPFELAGNGNWSRTTPTRLVSTWSPSSTTDSSASTA